MRTVPANGHLRVRSDRQRSRIVRWMRYVCARSEWIISELTLIMSDFQYRVDKARTAPPSKAHSESAVPADNAKSSPAHQATNWTSQPIAAMGDAADSASRRAAFRVQLTFPKTVDFPPQAPPCIALRLSKDLIDPHTSSFHDTDTSVVRPLMPLHELSSRLDSLSFPSLFMLPGPAQVYFS